MSVIREQVVQIRKARRCFLCCRKFEVGSLMHLSVNVNDGDLYSIYDCITCNQLLTLGFLVPDGEMYHEGDTKETMQGNNFKGTPEEFLEHMQRNGTNKRNQRY